MDVLIVNGPNLNLLGVRETSIYGAQDFESYFKDLQKRYPQITLRYFQSNSEGALIDCLHQYGFDVDSVILNAGGYTHTSVALADAITAIKTPVVEVHISNIHKRESFRHHSFIAPVCIGSIIGFGLDSYRLALESLIARSES